MTNLTGTLVRLEPLTMDHCDDLCEVGLDPSLWAITMTVIRNRGEMEEYIRTAQQEQASGTSLPFAIRHLGTGKAVGSSRYGNIEPRHRRLEIGWTWIAPAFQRTGVNTETKYLMLRHAFEVLKVVRVEFKTDVINQQSRRALLRIGAKEEGVMRKHQITPQGRIRDSVYYSITDDEWPGVKLKLEGMLRAPG